MTRPSISLPDRYTVVKHLASGGMAAVYEAHDEVLGRDVAVKVLAHHLTADESARKRFEREARAAAGLSSHPHVVTIYDVGEHGENSFIVMELMCCGSLADRIREGRVESEQAIAWLRDAASALDAAHEAGIVHRDIKPPNLLLDERDRLAIADFGIARLALDDQVTQTGQVLGTASYLAPEQAAGEASTAASDRYALAVVAFEMLTGRRPFAHESFAAQARAHIEEPPPDASEIDSSVSAATAQVLRRGLAKNPADRWPSAAVLVDELERSLDAGGSGETEATRRMAPIAAGPVGGSVPARASSGQPPRPPAPRRVSAGAPPPSRRGLPIMAALIGLLFAAIVLAAVLSGGDGGGPQAGDGTERPAPSGKGKGKGKGQSGSKGESAAEATAEPTQTPAQEGTQPDEGRAAQLNSEGFSLMNAGRYDEAVGPLREAYEACRGSEALDPCGFALYNLGRSLRLAGDPDAAVPILEERLDRFPDNQKDVVKDELKLAKKGDTGDGGGSSGDGDDGEED